MRIEDLLQLLHPAWAVPAAAARFMAANSLTSLNTCM